MTTTITPTNMKMKMSSPHFASPLCIELFPTRPTIFRSCSFSWITWKGPSYTLYIERELNLTFVLGSSSDRLSSSLLSITCCWRPDCNLTDDELGLPRVPLELGIQEVDWYIALGSSTVNCAILRCYFQWEGLFATISRGVAIMARAQLAEAGIHNGIINRSSS